jgi:GT2 family glycosyltransferase
LICEVSVSLITYKNEHYIYDLIKSLLNQTFKNFEIVIVEDPPFNETKSILERFNDESIRYFRNKEKMGISKSRNRCLKLVRGKYIFFTDTDCIVRKDWIEQGLKYFKKFDCIGVEGKLYYKSKHYKPTISERQVKNLKGGLYMTANIAYKKSIIKEIGYFDEKYTYMEDRDFALRAKKFGNIIFNPKMVVYHQTSHLSPLEYIKKGKEIRNKVLLYKKFGEKREIYWKLVYPQNLLAVIFPPLILYNLFSKRYKKIDDLIYFPSIYLHLVYERLNLWYMCIKEGVFLI